MRIIVEPPAAMKDLLDIPEPDLVAVIFSQPGWLEGIGNPPQTPGPIDWRLAVEFRDLRVPPPAAGDIDALIVSGGRTDEARAVQFKRIKIGEHALKTGDANKLRELKTLVRQTNLVHRLGFAYAWATVVVTTDIRSHVPARGMFAATPGDMMQRVFDAFPWADLSEGVGVSICEINQSSDAPAHRRGSAGSQMARGAVAQAQPAWLTGAITDVFARQVPG